jgi:hypothetical protein
MARRTTVRGNEHVILGERSQFMNQKNQFRAGSYIRVPGPKDYQLPKAEDGAEPNDARPTLSNGTAIAFSIRFDAAWRPQRALS